LHNAGTEAVDISGYGLTDDITTPSEYNFPDGTIIPAGGYLLVWADNQPNQEGPGRYHATFGLSGTGDEINLFSPAGILVDRVDFNTHRQTNDISEGRFPQESATLVYMTTATPGGPNVHSSGGPNQAPVMLTIGDKHMILGETLSFTVNATDPDVGQVLTFSGTGLPAGASVNSSSGLFQWAPASNQAPSVNPVTVTATDNGTPQRNASRSFTIHVSLPPTVAINRETGGITMSVPTVPGRQYQVLFKNELSDATWTPLGGPRTAAGTSMEIPDTIGAQSQRFYKIEVVPQ
jgi:hypothetical protein